MTGWIKDPPPPPGQLPTVLYTLQCGHTERRTLIGRPRRNVVCFECGQ